MILVSILLLGYWFTWTVFCVMGLEEAAEETLAQRANRL
jgi:hypothetical protein